MRRPLSIALASLFIAALLAPTAQAATRRYFNYTGAAQTRVVPAGVRQPSWFGVSCPKLRTKLRKQKRKLANTTNPEKRSMIEINIANSQTRIKEPTCGPAGRRAAAEALQR